MPGIQVQIAVATGSPPGLWTSARCDQLHRELVQRFLDHRKQRRLDLELVLIQTFVLLQPVLQLPAPTQLQFQ